MHGPGTPWRRGLRNPTCMHACVRFPSALLPRARSLNLTCTKAERVQDELFAKVATLVPGIREAESDDDFDLAKMMERHRQQSEKIRQEAVLMRQSMASTKCGLAARPPPPSSQYTASITIRLHACLC